MIDGFAGSEGVLQEDSENEPIEADHRTACCFKMLRFDDFPNRCSAMRNHAAARFFFCAVIF
jgi:hypothetical protein